MNFPPTFAELAAKTSAAGFRDAAVAEGPKPVPAIVQPSGPIYRFEPAFGLNDLVDVWYLLRPDTKLYDWQYQELLRISGYVDGTRNGPRVHWSPEAPFIGTIVACNDSGKDMTLISTTAIGMPLLYKNVRVVITSSSHDQLKRQTEAHIKYDITQLNQYFGAKIFDSIDLHHKMPDRGGEIALFATDEPGRAEGWHPLTKDGRLVLIKNEAKTIPENISDALLRCHGYSHFLEVSSPGRRKGIFYNNWRAADKYPLRPEPYKTWGRRITYRDCPHITEESAERVRKLRGERSFLFQTSFLANFYEEEEITCVPRDTVDQMQGSHFRPDATDVGIGLDGAAGGDETALYVRFGAVPTRKLFFREADTDAAVDRIHEFLSDLINSNYHFALDDNGVSRTFTDGLMRKGWRLTRVLNQSAARNKAKFLNRAAELLWHVRELYERRQIEAPPDELTIEQLCGRRYNRNNLGRISLESKEDMEVEGVESPDRADAFVLCFSSYRPTPEQRAAGINDAVSGPMSMQEFARQAAQDPFFLQKLRARVEKPADPGLYTLQKQKVI